MAGVFLKESAAGGCIRAAAALGTAFLGTAVVWAMSAALSAPADAQGGFGGMLRPGFSGVGRAINEGSRVSRLVLRPKLQVIREKEAGPVTELRMSGDRALLLAVLGDGTARLWDLDLGVQLGESIGGDVVTGAVRGDARAWKVIAVRRDGSSVSLSPDGAARPSGDAIPGLDTEASPVLSADGGVLAFRAAGGGWRLTKRGAEQLPGIVFERRPVLSPDGSRAFPLFGCGRGAARATVGAYTPDGRRIAFGDREGNICVWDLDVPTGEKPRRLFVKEAHSGHSIRAISVDGEGRHIATGGADGTVEVWSVEKRVRRVASFALGSAASGPLLLDVARGWVFAGEERGTVGIHSIEEGRRIARLISTSDGWAVVDREGRFDGPQAGVAALLWAGETKERETEALPVDAFSERYFEPGLLAKLNDPALPILNERIDDLPEDGFVMPPAVSIDPIDPDQLDASGRLSITVRIETGYRLEDVSEIRLYHNGKLIGQTVPGADGEGVFEYAAPPLPGENTFTAVGVGLEGIEGRSSAPVSATVTAEEAPAEPGMRIVAVGIDDYVRPDWKLHYSRNDVKAVAAALRERGGALFHGVDAEVLVDSSANASAIEDRILQRSRSHRDILVVYLAGHGVALKEGDDLEWYFLPFTDAWGRREVRKSNNTEVRPDAVRRHGLSSRELMRMLTGTEARRVFLVLDSCYSGAVIDTVAASRRGALDDAAGQKALHRIARVGGIHVLAAARANEKAAELGSEPHGALTYLVLEGIRGSADDDRDGTISVKEIIAYAGRAMPGLSRRLGGGVSQKPVGYSRGADFALAAGS